jgi:hypothetical protein
MVREGPAEPPPPNLAETTQGRRARPYGMLATAAVAALAVIIIVWFLLR